MAAYIKTIKNIGYFTAGSPDDHNIMDYYDGKCKNFIDYILNTKNDCTLILHFHGRRDVYDEITIGKNVNVYHMVTGGKILYTNNNDFYDMIDNMGKTYLKPKDVKNSMEYWGNHIKKIFVDTSDEDIDKSIKSGKCTDNIIFSTALRKGDDYDECWGINIVEDNDDYKNYYYSGYDSLHLNVYRDNYYYGSYIRFEKAVLDFYDYCDKNKINKCLDLNFITNLANSNKYGANINIVTAACQN